MRGSSIAMIGVRVAIAISLGYIVVLALRPPIVARPPPEPVIAANPPKQVPPVSFPPPPTYAPPPYSPCPFT